MIYSLPAASSVEALFSNQTESANQIVVRKIAPLSMGIGGRYDLDIDFEIYASILSSQESYVFDDAVCKSFIFSRRVL